MNCKKAFTVPRQISFKRLSYLAGRVLNVHVSSFNNIVAYILLCTKYFANKNYLSLICRLKESGVYEPSREHYKKQNYKTFPVIPMLSAKIFLEKDPQFVKCMKIILVPIHNSMALSIPMAVPIKPGTSPYH